MASMAANVLVLLVLPKDAAEYFEHKDFLPTFFACLFSVHSDPTCHMHDCERYTRTLNRDVLELYN